MLTFWGTTNNNKKVIEIPSITVMKSDGRTQEFSDNKLDFALTRAGVPRKDRDQVISIIEKKIYHNVPTSEIRKWVIIELNSIDPKYSKGFEYKKSDVLVFGGYSSSDVKNIFESFTKQRIIDSLITETGMSQEEAADIANETEHFLIESNLGQVSGSMIREIVNGILLRKNLTKYYALYQKIGMPVYDITQLINIGDKENANLQFNPETVHKLIADNVARRYALTIELPKKLAEAHVSAQIHIHDLDYFSTRPFCFSHDLRFFLRNGFKADGQGLHTAIAGPAKNASVAILHAAKILASAQTNCAGGQGYNWFNIILAPYLKGLGEKELRQLAQMFIYEMSQMYVARGGQIVFSSIDIEPGIPKALADIPAVQPGGIFDEKVTYSDFTDEARNFFNAITEVYLKGDYVGKPFSFPKYEMKLSKGDFKKYPEELRKVSELAAKFGSPYFFVQQDYLPEFACYQCCSYLMPLSNQNTDSDLYNGTVRGGALQVVTINLPQIAYESKGNDDKLIELLNDRMQKTKEVMLIKQELIKKRLKQGLLPFMAQAVDDKKNPYLLVDKQSLEVGMVGLNEMTQFHTGEELHESDAAWTFGLKIMGEMKKIAAELRNETGFFFGLSRTPAESSSYRMARVDMRHYPDAIVQGDVKSNAVYYTNSFHIRPSADVSLVSRIQREAAFHPLMDGGAMSHIWLGEGTPDPDAILKLTERIATKTLMGYFAYTKDLTLCSECLFTAGGMLKTCPKCGSSNVDWYSRITGYYQRVSSWNKGKQQELKDRKRYNVAKDGVF